MSKKEKSETKSNKIIERFKTITKRSWWKSHLPWPGKFIRKPKVRFNNPFAGKSIPGWLSSRYFLLIFVYILIFFFLSGGMYFLVGTYRDWAIIPGPGTPPVPIIFWRAINDQLIIEGLLAGMTIFFGFGGFICLYNSSKNFYKPKASHVYLAIGIVLVLASFLLIEIMMFNKGINLYSE